MRKRSQKGQVTPWDEVCKIPSRCSLRRNDVTWVVTARCVFGQFPVPVAPFPCCLGAVSCPSAHLPRVLPAPDKSPGPFAFGTTRLITYINLLESDNQSLSWIMMNTHIDISGVSQSAAW
jgi:hypothetical protein